MFTPEMLWPLGAALLLVVLVYGMIQYKTRNRANDRVTDKAAKALYDDPTTYTEQTRDDLKKEVRPS
jgi:hypothetical protein